MLKRKADALQDGCDRQRRIRPCHASETVPPLVAIYISDNETNSTTVATDETDKTLERFESVMKDFKLKTCITCRTTALSLELKPSGKCKRCSTGKDRDKFTAQNNMAPVWKDKDKICMTSPFSSHASTWQSA